MSSSTQYLKSKPLFIIISWLMVRSVIRVRVRISPMLFAAIRDVPTLFTGDHSVGLCLETYPTRLGKEEDLPFVQLQTAPHNSFTRKDRPYAKLTPGSPSWSAICSYIFVCIALVGNGKGVRLGTCRNRNKTFDLQTRGWVLAVTSANCFLLSNLTLITSISNVSMIIVLLNVISDLISHCDLKMASIVKFYFRLELYTSPLRTFLQLCAPMTTLRPLRSKLTLDVNSTT